MKIRGAIAIIILTLGLVYFLWIAKAGRKSQIVEKKDAFSQTKIELTKVNMANLEKAILSFVGSEGQVPLSLKELHSLRMITVPPVDAWGTELRYERFSDSSFQIISAGRDRAFGTEDDITLTR